jgi:hypothetical protein
MSYIHKNSAMASNSSVWNLTRPLVITFVLACGLVEAGPALAFVALLLTEAALQEKGEAIKLAFTIYRNAKMFSRNYICVKFI